MSGHLIVVDKRADWGPGLPEFPLVTAREYLANPADTANVRVFNLCRSYAYLSTGYYVSLLAEARPEHKVLPAMQTISDLSRKSLYSLAIEDLDELVDKQLPRASDRFAMDVFLGRHPDERLSGLARQIFDLFPCPMLRVEFRLRGKKWTFDRIRALSLDELDDGQRAQFGAALSSYVAKPWRRPRKSPEARYDLAILYNRDDPLPPSNRGAIRNFERVGRALGLEVEVIGRRDYPRLAEYDALFIRDTTLLGDYTYRFARKAQSEGLVVIDDPESIVKCTNKVYMAELWRTNKVPHPKTILLLPNKVAELEREIAWPIVLKIPDGTFSRGVFKARDRAELLALTARLFKESDVLLAQEYVYTEFDWRIGILAGKPLFACQYFMSKDHWQILRHKEGGRFAEGNFRTLPISEVPAAVLKPALKAARLIGDGLYGVDLKQHAKGVSVIEINDNPNLEAGVEDAVLGDELYRTILAEIIARLDRLRGRTPLPVGRATGL